VKPVTDLATALAQFSDSVAELRKIREHREWWRRYDPVAYLWLRRAERRGAIVPWTEREDG
jgi:hypothetical protein